MADDSPNSPAMRHTPNRLSSRQDSLELQGVGICLADRWLFRDLTLSVAPGDVATIMGPSGCGKSSLLNLLCGSLDGPFDVAGQVSVAGQNILQTAPEKRRMGVLYQDDLLFPHMTVAQNLLFGLPARISRRAERRAAVEAALRDAELSGFGDRDPATLSGGQRARVALMRTLLSEPSAVLLDEPFSKLDTELRQRVREFVFSHVRRRNLPTLLVTHDPDDASAAGGEVINLAETSH